MMLRRPTHTQKEEERHYRKNMGCRACLLCHALPHGNEFFAVHGNGNARHTYTHDKD
jgi:hypothetical protein